MLEFVLFFVTGLLLIVLLSANFEREVRSRNAALSLANEALRSWQINQDLPTSQAAAESAAEVFQLTPNHWTISLQNSCSSKQVFRVVATVRGVTERVQGGC